MNCFEWQNHASDFLDGTLPIPLKREADQHLDECGSCTERHKHFRLILTSVAGQPRSSLPSPIRRSPFATVIPKLDLTHLGTSRWSQMPWYLRIFGEGTAIILLVLGIITVGPKLKAWYDRHGEDDLTQLSALGVSGVQSSEESTNAPLARGNLAETAEVADSFSGSEGGETTDSNSDEGDGEEVAISDGDLEVGSNEVWRFNLKLDSPYEVRPKIVKLLTDSGQASNTAGIGGTEAPGGIQFDLYVPQAAVIGIKKQLEKLAPSTIPAASSRTLVQDAFTWYKNKSKQPVPHGKTHVVIWLSQI